MADMYCGYTGHPERKKTGEPEPGLMTGMYHVKDA